MLTGRFKLDREGKYSIAFHASSGRYFNWAYADAIGGQFSDQVPAAGKQRYPIENARVRAAIVSDPEGRVYSKGIVSRGGYFYMRQLYFSATPVRHLLLSSALSQLRGALTPRSRALTMTAISVENGCGYTILNTSFSPRLMELGRILAMHSRPIFLRVESAWGKGD